MCPWLLSPSAQPGPIPAQVAPWPLFRLGMDVLWLLPSPTSPPNPSLVGAGPGLTTHCLSFLVCTMGS